MLEMGYALVMAQMDERRFARDIPPINHGVRQTGCLGVVCKHFPGRCLGIRQACQDRGVNASATWFKPKRSGSGVAVKASFEDSAGAGVKANYARVSFAGPKQTGSSASTSSTVVARG